MPCIPFGGGHVWKIMLFCPIVRRFPSKHPLSTPRCSWKYLRARNSVSTSRVSRPGPSLLRSCPCPFLCLLPWNIPQHVSLIPLMLSLHNQTHRSIINQSLIQASNFLTTFFPCRVRPHLWFIQSLVYIHPSIPFFVFIDSFADLFYLLITPTSHIHSISICSSWTINLIP